MKDVFLLFSVGRSHGEKKGGIFFFSLNKQEGTADILEAIVESADESSRVEWRNNSLRSLMW